MISMRANATLSYSLSPLIGIHAFHRRNPCKPLSEYNHLCSESKKVFCSGQNTETPGADIYLPDAQENRLILISPAHRVPGAASLPEMHLQRGRGSKKKGAWLRQGPGQISGVISFFCSFARSRADAYEPATGVIPVYISALQPLRAIRGPWPGQGSPGKSPMKRSRRRGRDYVRSLAALRSLPGCLSPFSSQMQQTVRRSKAMSVPQNMQIHGW